MLIAGALLVISPDRRRWLREKWLDVLIIVITPPVLPPGCSRCAPPGFCSCGW